MYYNNVINVNKCMSYLLRMLCQLRLPINYNLYPFTLSLWDVSLFRRDYCLLTVHVLLCLLPSYQPFKSHHLVGSHKLQGVMMVTCTIHLQVTSTILCHCEHTSSVVTLTYMIPCSIVRLCSGVLLLSKQHCLFSCVVCILLFSSCHSCECVCCGTSRR